MASDDTVNDPLLPTDEDEHPFHWDGNNAHISGYLHEAGKFYTRNGLFEALFSHHAVVLNNGKLAIDSVEAIPFITGTQSDPRSFADPCPPTAKRVAKKALAARAGGRSSGRFARAAR